MDSVSASSAELSLHGLRKHFGGIYAIDDVNLSFPAGSMTAIIGPNGAGKTTLVNLITARIPRDVGEVRLDGARIDTLGPSAIVRRGVSRAFQVPQVFPQLTAGESITETIAVARHGHRAWFRRFPVDVDVEKATEMLREYDLLEYADTVAGAMPYGAKKRLDLALAAGIDPKIILLDEPAAGLGYEGREQMIRYIRRLWGNGRRTIILIEHDMDIVFSLAQRIIVLNFGKVLADGSPAAVKENPRVIEAYLGEEQDLSC